VDEDERGSGSGLQNAGPGAAGGDIARDGVHGEREDR
jgi:hypothetical protein